MTRKTVLFNNLRPEPWLQPWLDAAYRRVMDSGRYIGGVEVEAFEEEWAAYCGAKYCVACGNGFDALQLVFRFIRQDVLLSRLFDDEIRISPFTFLATWQAARAVGYAPEPLMPDDLTVGVAVPVYLYGIMQPLKWRTAFTLVDCAQAHGARMDGKRAGTQGDACAWSFYPTKNLGCYGDGGAITTEREWLAEGLRGLRNYGGSKTGINSRLDPLQAAFLRARLPHLDAWNRIRGENAFRYFEHLSGCPGVTLPVVPAGCVPSWHQFAIRAEQRDELKDYLSQNGIETLIHYPDHPYRMIYGRSLPAADEWCATTLSLPVAPHIGADDVEYVSERIWEFYDHRS